MKSIIVNSDPRERSSTVQALLVVDAQNEFSADGHRPVPNHTEALKQIHAHVEQARRERRPIAFVVHHNRPHEWPAFAPGSWGADLSPGLGVQSGFGPERGFTKDVFGAFTGTDLEGWLRSVGADEVLIVGFYSHMCLSTSAREALVRDFRVVIDPEATGTCELEYVGLGRQSADEVRRSALLQLASMGASVLATAPREDAAP
jgi:nicotinamidase-related amidase